MAIRINGIWALLIGIIILAFLIAVFVIVGGIFLIILPVLIVFGILAFIFRRIIPKKKSKSARKQEYIDAEFKVKG